MLPSRQIRSNRFMRRSENWTMDGYITSDNSDAMLHSPRPVLYLASYDEKSYLDPACFLRAVLDSNMCRRLPVVLYIPQIQLRL